MSSLGNRWISLLLALVVLVSSVGIVRPEPAVAVVPLVVAGGAALAALGATAGTYAVSPSFRQWCTDSGISEKTGTVIANMVQQYKSIESQSLGTAVSTAECAAVLAYLRAQGGIGLVQARAESAGSWLGDIYYDLTGVWEGFGFQSNAVTPSYVNSTSYKSGVWNSAGRSWGTPTFQTSPQQVSLVTLAPASYAALGPILNRIASDPTYQIKGWGATLSWYDGTTWGKVYSIGGDVTWSCSACSAICPISGAFHYGTDTYNSGWVNSKLWTAPGSGAGGAMAWAAWLIAHNVCTGAVAVPLNSYAASYTDADSIPLAASVPQHLVEDRVDAATIPLSPQIYPPVLPPYFPDNTLTYPGVGTGGLTGIGTAIGTASTAIGAVNLTTVPDGFRQILEWFLTPIQAMLLALQGIVEFLANIWANVESFFFKMFNPNGQQLKLEFEPKWSGLGDKLKAVWPFALIPIVSAIMGAVDNGGSGSHLDTQWVIPYAPGRTFTFSLSMILTPIQPYRWVLVAYVWFQFALGLLALLRPRIHV